jgi:perosamine synthetase
MERIPVSGPWITDKEIACVADAARNAWYANANMYNTRFEAAFAQFIGTRFAASLPSCTSAIHLSLLALGIGPGDEVIVPDATWIATSAPITYVGATPVFADVDEKTWCLSAESFEECITPQTRAVIPVDLYGGLPDMDAIREIAQKHRIAIVEDAAEAVGATYRGKRAGSFGETGVFSFHGSKTLTTGEGGMLVTDREDLWKRIQFLRDHGRSPGDRMFYNTEVAWKYKMSSLQAALGLAQLERIDELVARKREIFNWYTERLRDVPEITLNYEPHNVQNVYWMVTVIVDPALGLAKEDLMRLLLERGIDTRPFFHPLSSLPAYRNCPSTKPAQQRNRVSYQIGRSGVNLPSGFNMTEPLVNRVVAELRSAIGGQRASILAA